MANRLQNTLHTMDSSEEKFQLLKQIEKQLHNILGQSNMITGVNHDDFARSIKSATQKYRDRFGDEISRLMNLQPKSIKDQLDVVEMSIKFNVVFAFAETGFMIQSLRETWNEINKSEQYRRSSELQQETDKIKKVIDEVEKLYRTVNIQIDEIHARADIHKQQITLKQITLDLEIANVKCENVQQVLNNILSNIHHKVENLSSAKATHRTGTIESLLRLFDTVINYILKPASGLSKLFKLFIASLNTVNVIGHAAGFRWTHNEIQELKKYQVILSGSQNKIKQLTDDIHFRLEILEKFQKNI